MNYIQLYSKELQEDAIKIIPNYLDGNLEISKLKRLEEKSIEILEKIYKKENKFKSLIMFISLAKIEEFELSVLEKTMRVFNTIETFYFLYTSQSQKNALNIQEKLRKKGFKVKIQEVESENYTQIYTAVLKILDGNRDEFLIDATLGPKMIFHVLAKFSVENDIKIITWQSQMEKDIEGKNKRLPGTNTLNFNKAPAKENYSSYRKADLLVNKFKYKEASYIYEALKNIEMENLCKKLDQIFQYENLMDLKDFVDNKYDEIDLINTKMSDVQIKEDIQTLDMFFQKISSLGEKELKKLEIILLFNFINQYYDTKGIQEIFISDIEDRKNIDIDCNLINISFTNFLIEIPEEFRCLEELLNDYNPEDKFLKNMQSITYENQILYLPKYNLNLKIKVQKNSSYNSILIALFETASHVLIESDNISHMENSYSLRKIIENDLDFYNLNSNIKNNSYRRKFKLKINNLNENIAKQAKEQGRNIPKLFEFRSEIKDKITYKLSLNI